MPTNIPDRRATNTKLPKDLAHFTAAINIKAKRISLTVLPIFCVIVEKSKITETTPHQTPKKIRHIAA